MFKKQAILFYNRECAAICSERNRDDEADREGDGEGDGKEREGETEIAVRNGDKEIKVCT